MSHSLASEPFNSVISSNESSVVANQKIDGMKRRLRYVLLIACIIFVGILLTGTRGGLGYFSPYTLEYVSQSEFTLFWGSCPIYRSAAKKHPNEVLEFIQREGFVSPQTPQAQRWEVAFHWNETWRDGYGSLYYVLGRQRNEVIEWSTADRERAEIYWSEGFTYLRSEQETDMMIGRTILESCWRCESVADLKKQIADIKFLFSADRR